MLPDRVSKPGPLTYNQVPYRLGYAARPQQLLISALTCCCKSFNSGLKTMIRMTYNLKASSTVFESYEDNGRVI